MPEKNNISIKKIATLAGTSVATVSRVINHNGRFSKETEERVLQIIEAYDYHPNVLAKGLRQNSMNLIGVIIPDITSSFFSRIYRTLESELYRKGYLTILCDTNENDELEMQYMAQLNNLRFSGLISLNGNIEYIKNSPTASIFLDRQPICTDQEEQAYFIGSNNYQGGYIAATTLIKAGKKKLGIMLFDKQLETQKDRYAGFCQALNDHQLPLYMDLVKTVNSVTYDEGFQKTEELLAGNTECDGIFYTSDILAIGGKQCMLNHGMALPDDCAILGMDDIPLSKVFDLSTIHQSTTELGKLAAESIVALIEGRPVEKTQILDVHFVHRGTL